MASMKVRRVDPPDYEKELSSRKSDLKEDPFPILLQFPQQDITVKIEGCKFLTQKCPVTEGDLLLPTQLFTKNCLAFYSDPWKRVMYSYSKYSGSYTNLLDEEERESLPLYKYERDQLEMEAEKLHQEEVDSSKRKALTKSGFLYKGQFPNDTGIGLSIKNYRKRWFELKGGPTYGGYTLVYYRDGKSSSIKGTINLEICTDIRANQKYRPFGFDLVTEDEKVFYPLATETQKDMEDWLIILGRALGIIDEEVEETTPNYAAIYSQENTLRDTSSLQPDLLKWNADIDKINAQNRQSDEQDGLFLCYPDLLHHQSTSVNEDVIPLVPSEEFGYQVKVTCQDLSLKLTLSRFGKQELLEPFYVTLALYDATEGVKISEDFNIDLTNPEIKPTSSEESSNSDINRLVKETNKAIFSVSYPHPEVYLVARIEKVLQGTISSGVEPYLKPGGGDSLKADKLSKQVTLVYEKLGNYRMPFAWTAKPLFGPAGNELNQFTELSPLFKQERDKLTDQDLLKLLADFKNIGRYKLQTIPGHLGVVVQQFNESHDDLIFSPSLLPLAKQTTLSPSKPNVHLQVREFPTCQSSSNYRPHLSLTNHLYVYPLSLKYETQKQFSKARNIAVFIEFRDSDESDAQPLQVIYSSQSGNLMTSTESAAVLYHCVNPAFYKEVKISLPVRISRRHHLLFIFKHISCDISKTVRSSKGSLRQSSAESIVGYTWLPILEPDGSINTGAKSLPIATSLPPGYLSVLRGDLKKNEIPDVKWVDNNKLLFSCKTFLDSSIYTEDSSLFTFFSICDLISSGREVDVSDIRNTIESLEDIETEGFKFLPILFDQLFALICQSFDPLEEVKSNVLKVLISIVSSVTAQNKKDLLKIYIEYIFSTDIDDISSKSVHDEIINLLVKYFEETNDAQDNILQHVWFFLEIALKSMAQYLFLTDRESGPRKNRYPQEYGNDLLTLLSHLIPQVCLDNVNGQVANNSIAKFIKVSFSLMDRGTVFKLIDKCFECFDVFNNEFVCGLRLDLLNIVCQHEHFIPLNLPFETKAIVTQFYLNNEYCKKHYLSGLLLRELEMLLQIGSIEVRTKAIEIVRNLLVKLDLDERFTVTAQKSRIAALFFPLIPLIIKHYSKLHHEKATNGTAPPEQNDLISEASTPPPTASLNSNVNEDGTIKKPLLTDPSPISSADGDIVLMKKSSITGGSISSKTFEAINPIDVSMTSTPPHTPGSVTDPVGESLEEVATVSEDMLLQEEGLSLKETRELLICFLFVTKYCNNDVLFNWWQQCIDATSLLLSRSFSFGGHAPAEDFTQFDDTGLSELFTFFDILELCMDTFEYSGRLSITNKWSARTTMLKQLEEMCIRPNELTKTGNTRMSHVLSRAPLAVRGRFSQVQSDSSIHSSTDGLNDNGREEYMDLYIKLEGALGTETGLIILDVLNVFANSFKNLIIDEEYKLLNKKFFSLLVKPLDVHASTTLQVHAFATMRSFTYKFSSILFKASSDYCGPLCYQILRHCNSDYVETRTEAVVVLYLMMKENFKFCKQTGFSKTGLQVATSQFPYSHVNLRKSLGSIANYVDRDDKVKSTIFPREVKDLMTRLRTVLISTAQMKEHMRNPEKLLDLYYSLAKSYAHSQELRLTWLESMAEKHISYGDFSEAAQCYLHIAGLIAEHLRVTGKHIDGCSILSPVSRNIEREERTTNEMSKETSLEQIYSEKDLVIYLEHGLKLLEKSEHYELMTAVFKLLIPYYESNKDFKKIMELYGCLYEAHKKIVSIMQTGQRYLGTYYRVALYGGLFGDDHKKQFIYREPKLTSLPEITQRLIKLYTRKFGPNVVQIIQDSGKVDIRRLDVDKAYIQVTHAVPYFTEEELAAATRSTQFEKESQISRFVFETPFTLSGKAQGGVASQHMRKTILTTSHWFPYIVKRIPVIDTEFIEMSPIEVAIEAIEKKINQLAVELNHKRVDLVKLQLLLQGTISTQVNQGIQEYANVFLKEPYKYQQKHISQLKEVYRSFVDVCEIAINCHGQLISKEQHLLQQELVLKFVSMKEQLAPLLDPSKKQLTSTQSLLVRQKAAKPELSKALTLTIIPTPSTM